MSLAQAPESLNERWQRFFKEVAKPARCMYCNGTTIWWNGCRVRSANVLCNDVTVHLNEVPCRRVKCGAPRCRRSWTLRPEGLTPQRHYQLDVVAEGCITYLFEPTATLTQVAETLTCSRQTVRRWLAWVGAITTVSVLLRVLLEVANAPITPRIHAIHKLSRKAKTSLGAAGLVAARNVLCLLETIGAALAFSTPGLSSVVQVAVADRYRVTTYAQPFIPDFVRRISPGLRSSSLGER